MIHQQKTGSNNAAPLLHFDRLPFYSSSAALDQMLINEILRNDVIATLIQFVPQSSSDREVLVRIRRWLISRMLVDSDLDHLDVTFTDIDIRGYFGVTVRVGSIENSFSGYVGQSYAERGEDEGLDIWLLAENPKDLRMVLRDIVSSPPPADFI